MTVEAHVPDEADARGLAASLAPLVSNECNQRLGSVNWFRADWQRGGAATGSSTYTLDDGSEDRVVLKMPVSQRELFWTRALQARQDDPAQLMVPRLYASGDTIGGYDLAWIVIEYFEHGPLGLHWEPPFARRIAHATARFHQAALQIPVDQPPRVEDWPTLIDESLDSVRLNALEHEKDWIAKLKKLRAAQGPLVEEWRARSTEGWVHGDLHIANAMCRESLEDGPVALIDLAEVHAGHWVEDAVYLERQFWARPERVDGYKPVRELARARKNLGLPVEEDYARLAMLRRGLLAATAPRFIKTEGHPKHLEACLTWLGRALDQLT